MSQVSLLAEVEAQAFWNGSRMVVEPLQVAGRKVGTIHSYERRMFGLGIGIRDGVVLLNAAPHRFSVTCLADRLGAAAPADVATFRVAGPAAIDLAGGDCVIRGRHATSVAIARDIQEVLAIGASFPEFLNTLGRSSRRNVRACCRLANEAAVGFRWATEGPAADMRELKQLCRNNMPTPSSTRRIDSVHRLIAGKARAFHAALRDASGQLISAGGGFIERETALMLYQYNHRSYRSLNPSLLLRTLLIERLCGENVRHLAFVGKCSGLLRHACDRIPAAEMLITRNSVLARLKTTVCHIAEPRSRIGRLLTVSGAPADEAPLLN